jgi:hypothetical protein
MKTLLRNKTTGWYFRGVADWTPSLTEAFNFPYPEKAARFVRAARLNANEMEIVFGFDNPAHNISLPLDERFELLEFASTGPAIQPPPDEYRASE